MSSTANDFLGKLIETFRLEADEHLKAMVAGLLALEKATITEEQTPVLETIFREAHSLKGAARAVNLDDIEAVCQSLEGVFALLKRREFQLSPNGFDTIHGALDTVEVLLNAPDEPHATQVAEAVQGLTRLELEGHHNPRKQSSEITEKQVDKVLPLPTPWAAEVDSEEESCPVSTNIQQAMWQERLQAENLSVSVPQGNSNLRSEQISFQAKPAMGETVRVSIAKLDSLFLQAEEMLSVKLSVNQHAFDLREVMAFFSEWKKEWAKVSSEVRKVQRIVENRNEWAKQGLSYLQTAPTLVEFLYWNEQQFAGLENRLKGLSKMAEHDQQTVGALVDNLLEDTKRVLMLPFSSLLEIFPKMIRDLSRTLAKDVELVIRGGEVEIDKRILEELKTPLIHLLRNSLDHGIETPEVRTRYEKSPRGTIVIAVSQVSGSSVEILISDDGGGIDCTKIKQAVVKRGLLSPKAVETIDEQAALALIFQSEVSTSPIVTDISGRGLGMAIVREKIEKLGGQITIETHLHEGTSFRIILPLTLATFRGVFVQARDHIFVIPTISVERVVRIKRNEVKTVENKETVLLDGRPIALTHLDEMLQLPRKARREEDEESVLGLVLGSAEKRIVCCVDKVLHEQEVLFKSLGAYLAQVPNFAGATVLGSGKVVPILHIPDLLKSAAEGVKTCISKSNGEEETESFNKSILIAEDSVTSRMLLKGILESAGYQVTTAVDGLDAFSLLQKTGFDLVVSDVEMPRMNGFELTSRIRDNEQLAQVPVVLVTGLDSREDRERGIAAGADAYIVKTSFDQSNLLDVVQRLI